MRVSVTARLGSRLLLSCLAGGGADRAGQAEVDDGAAMGGELVLSPSLRAAAAR